MGTTIAIENPHAAEAPGWACLAFSTFRNVYGELWIAAFGDGGLVVSGGDIDWQELNVLWDELKDLPPFKLPRALQTKIFNLEELLWLEAVLCCARQRAHERKVP